MYTKKQIETVPYATLSRRMDSRHFQQYHAVAKNMYKKDLVNYVYEHQKDIDMKEMLYMPK